VGGSLEHHRKKGLDMPMIEAASDGRDQLGYIAGADAKEIYETRMRVGDEAFRKAMAQQFFWRYRKTRLVSDCFFSNERSDCPHFSVVFWIAPSLVETRCKTHSL
jgi:hypothetical protein